MKFGYFDDKNKEYVITNPQTPYPWINYLGNKDFFSIISNMAGGYCFFKDAKLRRITRYRYNNVPLDGGGRYFYINDGGCVWSPSWQPVKTPLDKYECRHGMGYTRITGEKNSLCASVLFFVPDDYNGEVQKLTLTNNSDKEKSFKLFSFVEWCLWNATDDCENFQRNFSTGEVEIEGNTLYHKTEYRERRNHFAFYYTNAKISGFDTDREAFLGMYNGFSEPEVVFKNKSKNSVAHGWSPIASHGIDITLEPHQSRDIIFILGYAENDEDDKWDENGNINKTVAHNMIKQMDNSEKADKAFEKMCQRWEQLLSIYSVNSPDEKLNRMVNIWNQYQCMVTFNMSRSASYFESGIGRGMGFRDSNQDILGFVHQIPERARERILDLASTQFEDGGCYHQYQPLTKKGNNAIGGDFSDDPLWLILSTVAYIKETGDFSILDEQVAFDSDEKNKASLLEHLNKSVLRVWNNVGSHGLPLIMRADWNDCLNLSCFSKNSGESFQTHISPKFGENKYSQKAESIFVAALFCYVGHEFARLLERIELYDQSTDIENKVEQMKNNIQKHGYDGQWYLRAYDDDGRKVGTWDSQEGKLFIEPQAFCVLAGIGRKSDRDLSSLNNVKKYLDTKYGLMICYPAYSRYYPEYGEISSYPAGYKENASVFCHCNAWIICAEATMGNGDRAFEYYSKIAPAYLEDISEIHKTEPYVYAQMIAGKDADNFGEAKNSWLTGTASWNFVAVSQYILGIFPEYKGLKLDPCIPHEWEEFSVTRKFRGVVYNIHFSNPQKVSRGIVAIVVDGKKIWGNILPMFESGTIHEVNVEMGEIEL